MFDVKRPTNRVGIVRLSIIALIVASLSIGSLMIAVLRNGDATIQDQLWQYKVQEINRQVSQVIGGEIFTKDNIDQDYYQQGLLQEYIEFDNNTIVVAIPNQLSNLLELQVREYIDTQINKLNIAITQTIQEMTSIELQQDDWLDQLEQLGVSNRLLTRGEFRVDAVWVALAIDAAFFVVTTGIALAKAMTWLTGSKPVINIIKDAAVGIFKFLRSILPEIGSFINAMIDSFDKSDTTLWLRWASIGGIIANILDMTDSTKKWDGWIIYR